MGPRFTRSARAPTGTLRRLAEGNEQARRRPAAQRLKLGRIGITVAPSDPKQLYALVDARDGRGLYHSSDAGESWERVNDEPRVCGRGSDCGDGG